MDAMRFNSWRLVRMRGAGPYKGSAWRIAAHVYRERAINCVNAITMLQQDMRVWEAAYRLLEAEGNDLLAACEEAERILGNMGYTDHEGEASEAYDQLRAAIAKAKGDQP